MEQTPRPSRRIISTDGFLHSAPSSSLRPSGIKRRPVSRPLQARDGFAPRTSVPLGHQNTPAIKPAVQSVATKTEPPKKHRVRKTIKWVVLSLVALILLSGGWYGWHIYRGIANATNNNNPFSLFSAFKPVPLKGQDTGHVNILLAGNSADDPGHDGANLTDSIMILSLNTQDHTAFILSIPRDLWVNIPGMGYQKINAASDMTNFTGAGYPNGGMGELEEVLHSDLGIDINYYALINYTAFRDMVNAVGGISINIQSPDKRGLYDPNIAKADGGPLKLANGWQQLNGQTALNLARARGDNYYAYGFPASDFDRTEHQRQMLMALKQKASTLNILTDSTKIANMFDAIGKNVNTDLQLNELKSLYSLTKDLNDGNIASYNLNNLNNKQLLVNYTSPGGLSALAPADGVGNFTTIQSEVRKLISNDPLVKESASVVVLNGSNTTGLAKQQGQRLSNLGLNLAIAADAPAGYAQTVVISNATDKPNTAAKLQQLYGVSTTTDATLTKNYPNADFIVVLGLNFTSTN